MTKKKNYIDPKKFYNEVIYSQELGYVTEELGKMFMTLAERNVNHRNFVRYPYREDLISVGVLACMKAINKFDPSVGSNAFAFFTTVIHNDLKQYIKREYNQQNIINGLKVENGLNPSHGYQDEGGFDDNE